MPKYFRFKKKSSNNFRILNHMQKKNYFFENIFLLFLLFLKALFGKN